MNIAPNEPNSTPAERSADRLWTAPLLAVPFSILLTGIAGATEIPVRYASFTALLGAVALGVHAAFRLFWAQILFFILASAILAWRPRRRWLRRLRGAATVLLCAAVSLQSYFGLPEGFASGGYPIFAALYGAFALALAAWMTSLDPIAAPALRSVARRRPVSIGMPIAFIAAAAAVHACNRTISPDAYETFHLGACRAAFLALNAGLASVLVRLDAAGLARLPERRAMRIRFVAISLSLAVIPAAVAPWLGSAKPLFRRYTALGRSEAALRADRGIAERSGKRTDVEYPNGVELFAELSNMPDAGDSFPAGVRNVLLISVECLRYRDSSFGDPRSDLTPNLRRFAARPDSFLFERAYSPAPTTLQVFSSIFTMAPLSLSEIELWDHWHGRLRDRAITVAELLREDGYQTFYAGHNYRGRFTEGGKILGLQQGFESLRYAETRGKEPDEDDTDLRVVGEARRALTEARADGRPFFGWVFFVSPHEPYYRRYPEMAGEGDHDLFRQEVRYADERIGELLSYLESTELWDDTIVVVHGDHGEAFGEHGSRSHSDVYTETTHVALAVRAPSARGRTVSGPVSLTYLFPWILGNGPRHARDAAFEAERRLLAPFLVRTGGAVAVEMLRPKGIRTALVTESGELVYDDESRHIEVYDLEEDPAQADDVYSDSDPVSKALVDRLEGYLEARSALGKPLKTHIVKPPKKRKRGS
ncbi:MAG: sulfatase [Proteobacteria bacterium]|jgi:arylsulfatase A-like enzyme|nr:sulfatase [Pseudomonadota bacterium]